MDKLLETDTAEETSVQKPTAKVKFDEIVIEPYNYLSRNNGKDLRKKLMLAFNSWLHVPHEPLHIIAEVVQMLHNASLIIDDIEDGSFLRRGQPAAHCVFGIPTAINSANFVYFLALQKLTELKHPEAVTIFTEQMLELHRGQGMDIYCRSSFRCPTEDEFCDMAIRKTGGLFGLAVRLMQLFSDNQKRATEVDIVDNHVVRYLPLYILFFNPFEEASSKFKQYHHSKTFAEDLTEGKFSFPIVWSIQTHPTDTQVMNILYQRSTNPGLKKYCVKHMAELGALDHTARVLGQIEEKCLKLIDSHGGNSDLTEFIRKLSSIYRTEQQKPKTHDPEMFSQESQTLPDVTASSYPFLLATNGGSSAYHRPFPNNKPSCSNGAFPL